MDEMDYEDGEVHESDDSGSERESGRRPTQTRVEDDADADADVENDTDSLYRSLGLENEEDLRHILFDTIRMRGTGDMTTDDVFHYFAAHRPIFLEWIDEHACDIVWKDDLSAMATLRACSKSTTDCYEKMDCDDQSDGAPPPGKWRAGTPHPKARSLYLRFGNKSDKKPTDADKLKLYSKKYEESTEDRPFVGKVSESLKSRIKAVDAPSEDKSRSKNPWGDLSKTWGINDTQEIFAADDAPPPSDGQAPRKSVKHRIGPHPDLRQNKLGGRLGKRSNGGPLARTDSAQESEGHTSDEDWKTKSKVPRLRMHADDVELRPKARRRQRKNADTTAEKIIVRVEDTPGVKERLGNVPHDSKTDFVPLSEKFTSRRRRKSTDSGCDSDENDRKNSIWGRLGIPKNTLRSDRPSDSDEDDSDIAEGGDLRDVLRRRKKPERTKNGDLRSRIGKTFLADRSPLRVEIDNELYSDS